MTATGIRVPLMQGSPPQMLGSTEILSLFKVIVISPHLGRFDYITPCPSLNQPPIWQPPENEIPRRSFSEGEGIGVPGGRWALVLSDSSRRGDLTTSEVEGDPRPDQRQKEIESLRRRADNLERF